MKFLNMVIRLLSTLALSSMSLGAVVTLFTFETQAAPAQVIIVRHGEKISDAETGLSPQGQARAEALVNYVLTNPILSQFGSPVAVFAARPKEDHSTRAEDTAAPLAAALGQRIQLEFGKADETQIVDFILHNADYNGKSVFIAWVHDEIPDLAQAFGVRNPPDWKGKKFDRTWVIRFRADGSVSNAAELTQSLLPGDTPPRAPKPLGF